MEELTIAITKLTLITHTSQLIRPWPGDYLLRNTVHWERLNGTQQYLCQWSITESKVCV